MLCHTGDPCLLHDYDAFLAVAFAVNTSVFAWWKWIFPYLQNVGERSKERQEGKDIPSELYLLEENRNSVDEVTKWLSRFTRALSGMVAIAIMAALLLLRATTPLFFWCMASVGAVPLLVAITVGIHHYRMRGIEKREADRHNLLGQVFVNFADKSSAGLASLPKSEGHLLRIWIWFKRWGSVVLTAAIVVSPILNCLFANHPESEQQQSSNASAVAGCSERPGYDSRVGVEAGVHFMGRHNWTAPYTCRPVDAIEDVDIEHIVAWAEARRSGLSCARAQEFMADPLNITVAYPGVNRLKTDKDAAGWLPQYNRCWFVARVSQVKRKYELTMDAAEASEIKNVLASCVDAETTTPACPGR